jgi:hypothetical protein
LPRKFCAKSLSSVKLSNIVHRAGFELRLPVTTKTNTITIVECKKLYKNFGPIFYRLTVDEEILGLVVLGVDGGHLASVASGQLSVQVLEV